MTGVQIDKCRGEGFIPIPKQVKTDQRYSYHAHRESSKTAKRPVYSEVPE